VFCFVNYIVLISSLKQNFLVGISETNNLVEFISVSRSKAAIKKKMGFIWNAYMVLLAIEMLNVLLN
jgi:hypothetical protein